MKAIRINERGGPEVLKYEDYPAPTPGPGQVLIDVAATGVNFVYVYIRTGLYNTNFPITPGNEAAGTVSAVGEGVTEIKVGDVVASSDVRGAYAEQALVDADRSVKLPPGLDPKIGAAAILQGVTAHFLVGALVAANLPAAHHRLGAARTTVGGAAALAAGLSGWAAAWAPWQLFGAALLSGIGWGA